MDKYLFLSDHLDRLLSGAEQIFSKLPYGENKVSLMLQIENELIHHFIPNYNYRLVMTKNEILLSKMPHAPKALEMSACLQKAIVKKKFFPSCVKNGDYQDIFASLNKAQSNGFDDVIFFNDKNQITEGSTSNIFIVDKNKKIITNPDSPNVLAGVMRKNLIQYINQFENGIEIREITREDLITASEIWATNAVQGLRFVTDLENKKRERPLSLFNKVLDGLGRFGEKFNG